ncbi:cytochrome P450 protein [Rutstroemia sp. NJR-2017a BBW]|nr:cytochrome P450 protein [Rutstroemia sp. NJR-2017a BBW]
MAMYIQVLPARLVASTLVAVSVSGLIYFSLKLYQARMLIINLRKKGLPVAPHHSFIFGHLLLLKELNNQLPRGAHYQFMFGDIARKYFLNEGVFYLDLWPMSGLFLTRPHLLERFFKPIAGGPNLFDLHESQWKPWRAVFAKGFSEQHIFSLVPGIVKETKVYMETLRGLARKGEMFSLDTTTLRFTMDMIGRTILNSELGAQRGYNAFADSMLSQIRWHQPNAEVNPLALLNPLPHYIHWRNSRAMNRYVGIELDKRYAEFKLDSSNTRSKAVVDLVLQSYMPKEGKTDKLDPDFKAFAIRQIRLFMFAGHDSTSITICYCVHLLSQNPNALARIRAEHDEVYGKDLAAVPTMLEEQPQPLNSLTYTLAVIKEALRLFPPAGSSRQGKVGESIVDDQGNICPTDHAMIWIIHVEMHRAPSYWVRPDEFLPERWLVEPGHELYPMKGAWRPFEHGPRNCIAQGLVMTELRVVLSCIIREFDFKNAYDEWDQLHPSKGLKTYRGERAYQVEEGAAHPVEHYPCRVKMADRN